MRPMNIRVLGSILASRVHDSWSATIAFEAPVGALAVVTMEEDEDGSIHFCSSHICL